MKDTFFELLKGQLKQLKTSGLYKNERMMTSPQGVHIRVSTGTESQDVLNFCANNYLGLADNPLIIEKAKKSYDMYGFGLASVRFICGTQTIHKELEERLSHFLGTENTILYSSCFDANGGLFEPLFGAEDAIISDALNHASIIDGIRLSKAKRLRYQHNDMGDLEQQLKESQTSRFRVIATDGVFSMDGTIANLQAICDLADKYHALVMVDDCHAVGFMGENGKGTPEYCGVEGRVDILTGTLGKALGGASGGYVSGKKEIVEWLRQRSRPYLFSNTLAPAIAAATLQALDLVESGIGRELRDRLKENSRYFRERMEKLKFTLIPGTHPIIPVMLGDASLAQHFAQKMLEHGIYVIGFCYPVVPEGKARIRTQMSAAHSKEDIDRAVDAFQHVGKELT
ncbi:MAG: glycine C-acetyltransferase [Parachlamydiaceae bacterium]